MKTVLSVIVGSRLHGTARRFLSSGCKFTGKNGYIPAMQNDPGYDGLFYDTTCPGWWGNSGGPVYKIDSEGNPTDLVGVVTHTFDVTSDGSLDTSKEGKDDFGTYIASTAISTFSLATQLDAMISQVQ